MPSWSRSKQRWLAISVPVTPCVRAISRMGDDEIDTAIARVATGKHGSCDHCLAGVFTRHIAKFSDNPDDPAVLREIWRLAEANVIEC